MQKKIEINIETVGSFLLGDSYATAYIHTLASKCGTVTIISESTILDYKADILKSLKTDEENLCLPNLKGKSARLKRKAKEKWLQNFTKQHENTITVELSL